MSVRLTAAAGLCAGSPPHTTWVPLTQLGWGIVVPIGYAHQKALSGLARLHDRGWMSDISSGAATVLVSVVIGGVLTFHSSAGMGPLAAAATAQSLVVAGAYLMAL